MPAGFSNKMYDTSRTDEKSCSWSVNPKVYLKILAAGALKLVKTEQII